MGSAKGLLVTGAVLTVALAGCSGETEKDKTYGASSAGPTKTSNPSTKPPVVKDPPAAKQAPRDNGSPCAAFSAAKIKSVLGLEVSRVAVSHPSGYLVCTWRATRSADVPEWRRNDPVLSSADGVVTITRGPAERYQDLLRKIEASAAAKKATGRQELPRVGEGALAVGASVSGVPIWQAITRHGPYVTAVEVSGADSRSSVATVSQFLLLTIT